MDPARGGPHLLDAGDASQQLVDRSLGMPDDVELLPGDLHGGCAVHQHRPESASDLMQTFISQPLIVIYIQDPPPSFAPSHRELDLD